MKDTRFTSKVKKMNRKSTRLRNRSTDPSRRPGLADSRGVYSDVRDALVKVEEKDEKDLAVRSLRLAWKTKFLPSTKGWRKTESYYSKPISPGSKKFRLFVQFLEQYMHLCMCSS